MTNVPQRLTENLNTNLPSLLPGDYEPLEGNPSTDEFAQLNVRLKGNPTGVDVYEAVMNALGKSGVGIDKIVSSTVDGTRCNLMLMMGNATGTAPININYLQDVGPLLRITINKGLSHPEQPQA